MPLCEPKPSAANNRQIKQDRFKYHPYRTALMVYWDI